MSNSAENAVYTLFVILVTMREKFLGLILLLALIFTVYFLIDFNDFSYFMRENFYMKWN